MPKFESHNDTFLKPRQLIKQFPEGLLQLNVVTTRSFRAEAVQPGNSYDPRAAIEPRLTRMDGHVLYATELVFPDDVDHRALGNGQLMRSPSWAVR